MDITSKENPSGILKDMGKDVVGFGVSAVGTAVALGYLTNRYTTDAFEKIDAGTGDITAKNSQKANLDYMIGGAKILGSLLVFYLVERYIKGESKMVKKIGYGIGTGMLTSASLDILNGYQLTQA